MEEKRWGFPNENDTCRIQKLYYDVNINTIFNRTKLRNLKKKFVKYMKFITKFKQNIVDPEIHTYQKIQDDAYQRVNESRVDDASQTSFTNEDVEKGQALFEIFHDAKDDCDKVKYYSLYWADSIEHIYNKINEIKTHQKKLKHYKKCSHCEKKDMVTNCRCKSNHKLCSDCSDDINECPVCNEDLGLQYCAICMENKREIVETGCENKHKTCKECLDKIIRKNNLCPFCRDYCSKEPVVLHPTSYYIMDNREDYRDYLQDSADDRRER
jgi:hypothetical protein